MTNPRSITTEAPYLPRSLDDLAALRQALLDAGEPPQVANGIAGWLLTKASGAADDTSAPTRSRYRRILGRHQAAGVLPRSGLALVAPIILGESSYVESRELVGAER